MTAGGVNQSAQDDEHLRLLSISHYVLAGLAAIAGCFPIIHLVLGIAMVFFPGALPDASEDQPPLTFVGILFVAVALIVMSVFWALAVCLFIAARNLARRSQHLFCLVIAGVSTVFCMPLGTILGVLTILVLLRPSVKEAFESPP